MENAPPCGFDSGFDGGFDRPIVAVSRDSRAVDPQTVFVAVRGATVDGHDLAATCRPAAVVAERDVTALPDVPVVRVADSRLALARLSAALYDFPSRALPVIGVTGTNGKTTVTTLIEGALLALGRRVGRIGTTGNAIGGEPLPAAFTTPEAPELQALLATMRDEGCDAVVMEVSSIGLSQRRVDGVSFHLGVFTNLTQDHLDFHGTMTAYGVAKARLFGELLRSPGGSPRALLCADDPAHRTMGAPKDAWTYGFSQSADYCILRTELAATGTLVSLRTPDGPVQLQSRLSGRFNAANAAAAYAALRSLEVLSEDAVRGLGIAAGPPGRFERIADPGGRLVVVDYAHSEDALVSVLSTVRELVTGAVTVVFGCGGDRDRSKRPKMGAAAARYADVVVLTSDNPRSEPPERIIEDILEGVSSFNAVWIEVDREAAIRLALARSGPGDAVVIAGKGHEPYQEVAGVRRPFDDRAVARAALGAE